MASGQFLFLRKSIEFSRPKAILVIDRDRAADLGISMADIGRNLATLLGGNDVNRFSLAERSYKVIPQVARPDRLAPELLNDYYVRSAGGELVPLGNLVRLEKKVEPSQRTQFQQLNSIIVEGILAPGVPMGGALAYLEGQAREILPPGYGYDYTGESRQLRTEGNKFLPAFSLAVLMIFMVLAVQFNSFRDPLVILAGSVPLAMFGAFFVVQILPPLLANRIAR